MPTIDSWNLPPTWLLWMVDLILALVIVEGAVLLAWLHRQGRPVAAVASGLLAGAGLAGALRIGLHQGPDLAVLACLALAGMAHAVEVWVWMGRRSNKRSAASHRAPSPDGQMAWREH
jgi:hypothetical protein